MLSISSCSYFTHARTHAHSFTALWTLSGTTQVSRYLKKQSPTHTNHSHPPCSIYVPNLFFYNLSPSFLWSTSCNNVTGRLYSATILHEQQLSAITKTHQLERHLTRRTRVWQFQASSDQIQLKTAISLVQQYHYHKFFPTITPQAATSGFCSTYSQAYINDHSKGPLQCNMISGKVAQCP